MSLEERSFGLSCLVSVKYVYKALLIEADCVCVLEQHALVFLTDASLKSGSQTSHQLAWPQMKFLTTSESDSDSC
jgi:hypothetical protein